jgi:hypothetical protein
MAFKQYISFLIILKIVKKTFNTDFKQVNFKCCESNTKTLTRK